MSNAIPNPVKVISIFEMTEILVTAPRFIRAAHQNICQILGGVGVGMLMLRSDCAHARCHVLYFVTSFVLLYYAFNHRACPEVGKYSAV